MYSEIHDRKTVNRDFRHSTCSVVVSWIGVSGVTACRSGACPWELKGMNSPALHPNIWDEDISPDVWSLAARV